MGTQDDFELAQQFVSDTGLVSIPLLWDPSPNLHSWNLTGVRTNSAMQLFSYDLSNESQQILWDERGKELVLDAAPQEGFAPPGSAQSQ